MLVRLHGPSSMIHVIYKHLYMYIHTHTYMLKDDKMIKTGPCEKILKDDERIKKSLRI